MFKFFIFLFSLFISSSLYSQNIDTIIDAGFYKSYYSNTYKCPLYVSYIIYKGGGDCDRSHYHFKNDVLNINSASLSDYSGNGYDQGHLCNAADFAFDCDKDEKTFRFYNCLPQTPNLNRGIWKKWETIIRKESQNDSLLIICGGIFSNKKIGNELYVPDFCWKVVIDLDDNKIKYCLLFTNDKNASFVNITIDDLKKLIGFKLDVLDSKF